MASLALSDLPIEFFESILQRVTDGVAIAEEGRIIYINDRLAAIFGRPVAELIGTRHQDFVVPDPDTAPGAASSDEERRYTATVLRPDRERRSVEVRSAPFEWQGRVLRLALIHDITERKVAEENVLEHRMKLFAASKMSALGEMASGIAHEINNPLSIIRSYANIVRDAIRAGTRSDSQVLECVEKIDSTVVRISKIIASLRGFARDSERDPVMTVPVRELVAETLDICEPRLRRHEAELRCPAIPAELELEGRRVPLVQVLLNLLNNAFDAVSGAGVDEASRWIEVRAEDRGDEVLISVLDGGPGVPAELRDRIMQPFFSTKRDPQGVGLGLSISRKIVEGHGGTLTLGEGAGRTRFDVLLPKRQRAEGF